MMDYKLCFIAGGIPEYRQQTSRVVRNSHVLCIEVDSADMILDACKTVIPEVIVLDDDRPCDEIRGWVEKLRALPRGQGPMVVLRAPQSSGFSCEKDVPGAGRCHIVPQGHFHEDLHTLLQGL